MIIIKLHFSITYNNIFYKYKENLKLLLRFPVRYCKPYFSVIRWRKRGRNKMEFVFKPEKKYVTAVKKAPDGRLF